MSNHGGYRFRKPVCVGHVGGKVSATARNILAARVRGEERWAWIADDGCVMVCESERQIPGGMVLVGCYGPSDEPGNVYPDVRLAIREFAERAVIERAAA